MLHSVHSELTSKKPPSIFRKIIFLFLGFSGVLTLIGGIALGYIFIKVSSNLPSLECLTDYHPKIPLRVYTSDHVLIGEFGEERRDVVPLNEIPELMKRAVIVTEDERFYKHKGIDFLGLIRAAIKNLSHHGISQGASTITMQVARNFFLSKKKTYIRKIYEMVLAKKIENTLTKDQILELYMNQIYLGQKTYGFESASQLYFGVSLKKITLAKAALLAGLPKAPSLYNPVANLERSKMRQRHILKRMLDLKYINKQQYENALNEEIRINRPTEKYSVHGEYVAEMVRQMMFAKYKEEAYTRGFSVTTTINSTEQENAYDAIRTGILKYESRHQYYGPEAYIQLPSEVSSAERMHIIEQELRKYPDNGDIVAAVVLSTTPTKVVAVRINGEMIKLGYGGLDASSGRTKANTSKMKICRGAIIRLIRDKKSHWRITQLPRVEGALIAMAPQDGAIRALVGGFDFNKNKFNHATQAWRQPGSSFKPIIYSASLEKGLGPATLINDGPIFFNDGKAGRKLWIPKNYGGHFDSPMSMRTALMKSENLVTVRIMQQVGPKNAQEYATRFGFDAEKIPPYLSTALGTGSVTALQMARAYSVFANGGYRIDPYFIKEIKDADGMIISQAYPVVAGRDAPITIDPGNAYIMNDMLHSVASQGTAERSNALGRDDLSGKTGTTNNSLDAWFAGYQHTLVAVTWIGYDHPHSLGVHETGGGISLPIWIDFMRNSLKEVPSYKVPIPDNVTLIDGELYLTNRTPGNGFVSTLGISFEGETDPGIDITPQERKQVLSMFDIEKNDPIIEN